MGPRGESCQRSVGLYSKHANLFQRVSGLVTPAHGSTTKSADYQYPFFRDKQCNRKSKGRLQHSYTIAYDLSPPLTYPGIYPKQLTNIQVVYRVHVEIVSYIPTLNNNKNRWVNHSQQTNNVAAQMVAHMRIRQIIMNFCIRHQMLLVKSECFLKRYFNLPQCLFLSLP